jgi:RHS repeat-associated protein
LIDGTQTPVVTYAYDPFGKLMKKTGTFDQPYMFSTKPYDPDTGLYYFGARFYSPMIRRWMTRDPSGEASDFNLYRAVANNATNWVDPWGLLTELITFSPVGYGKSSFGHTAINLNGMIYSFGEKGWFMEQKSDYMRRNNFRDAIGQELNLTLAEEALLQKLIKDDMAENPKWSPENSCVTKARDLLEKATSRMFRLPFQQPIIAPIDFRDNLTWFGYAIKTNLYQRTR